MAEGLETAAGVVVDLPPAGMTDEDAQREFAKAMSAPEPDAPQAAAPPKREGADPDAPYGRTKDGRPKKGPGGRPAKPKDADKPRVTSIAPPQAAAAAKDYTAGLAELIDGAWFLLAPGNAPMRAQACLLKVNKPGLVHGFNTAAQHQPQIRAGVEFLTANSWVTILGAALVPFIMGSISLWSGKIDEQTMNLMIQATTQDLEQIQSQQTAEFMAAAATPMTAA